MKNLALLFFLLGYTFATAQSTDEGSIRQVITSAYIEGIQNGGSADDIRKGIHPSFAMLRLIDNEIKPYPIEDWIVALEKQKKESKSPAPPRAEGKFISIDITGTAAIVKLELYRGGKRPLPITLYFTSSTKAGVSSAKLSSGIQINPAQRLARALHPCRFGG